MSNVIRIGKRRTVVMILATSIDLTIGKDNDIPWDCKTDMQFFKRATSGHAVVMGRKTFESMNNKPLPNRVNIVISKTLNQEELPQGVTVVTSLKEGITFARTVNLSKLKRNTLDEHIFIIGGVQIYKESINMVNELLRSEIDVTCGANGYGSEFMTTELMERFYDDGVETAMIYYNNNAIASDDKDKLKEITHSYRYCASSKLTFL